MAGFKYKFSPARYLRAALKYTMLIWNRKNIALIGLVIKMFNISPGTVRSIRRGDTWYHVRVKEV